MLLIWLWLLCRASIHAKIIFSVWLFMYMPIRGYMEQAFTHLTTHLWDSRRIGWAVNLAMLSKRECGFLFWQFAPSIHSVHHQSKLQTSLNYLLHHIDLIHAHSFQDYVIDFLMANCKRREGCSVLQPDCCVLWQRQKVQWRLPWYRSDPSSLSSR